MNKISYREMIKMDLAIVLVFFFSLLLHNAKGEFSFNCNFTFFGVSMRMEHYLKIKIVHFVDVIIIS